MKLGGRILLLGGTGTARRLAERLAAALPDGRIIYSLAGATDNPRLPHGENIEVRIGGFGGAQGLAAFLREQGIAAVIDATHPHARRMPAQVAEAAVLAGVPHARYLPAPPAFPPASSSFPRKRESTAHFRLPLHLLIRALDPRFRGDDGGRECTSGRSGSLTPTGMFLPVHATWRGAGHEYSGRGRRPRPATDICIRHCRARPGSPEPRAQERVALDARVKPGHDGGGEHVVLVDSIADMAGLLPPGVRVFAALGSRGLAELAPRSDLWLTARMIAAPSFTSPPRWRLLKGRAAMPRASITAELALLRATRAQWLLARQSAGSACLVRAAMLLGVPVLLLRVPPAPQGVPVLHDVSDVLKWLNSG